MKYAVIYQSKSGNTEMLAKQIYRTLGSEDKEIIDLDSTSEIPEADVYFVGFGIHDYSCSMNVLDTFEKITGGQIALFATCGYMPTDKYKANLEKNLDVWLPDEAEYLGMFLCQGNVQADRREIMLEKMPGKEKELNRMFEVGSTHPNQDDLMASADFTARILAGTEYR